MASGLASRSQGVGGGGPAELHKPPAPRTHGQDECSQGGGGEQTCALGCRASYCSPQGRDSNGLWMPVQPAENQPMGSGPGPQGVKGMGKVTRIHTVA